jgi:hypothetical protein
MYLLPSGQLHALPGGLGCAYCGPPRDIRMQQLGSSRPGLLGDPLSRESKTDRRPKRPCGVLKLTGKLSPPA